MAGSLGRVTLLMIAVALAGCSPVRTCEGDECSCSSNDDCIIGCSMDPEPSACSCTNGWPVRRQGHEGEEGCGEGECATVTCADWTEYEARCSFGRCVGVPVGDRP